MDKGVALFIRSRRIEDLSRELDDIAAAQCSHVVMIMTEFDIRFFAKTMQQAVSIAQEKGLRVLLDPWALGGVICTHYSLFPIEHPEACQWKSDGTYLPRACPNHPTSHDAVTQWVQTAVSMGADGIFWDEPALFRENDQLWACRCPVCQEKFRQEYGEPMPVTMTESVFTFRKKSLLNFLKAGILTPDNQLEHWICLLPREEPDVDWEDLVSMPQITSVGIDPYWFGVFSAEQAQDWQQYVRVHTDTVSAICEKNHKHCHIWLQGFNVPANREKEIAVAAELVREHGVDGLFVWVDRYGCGDDKASDRPNVVWDVTKNVFQQFD